MVIVYFVRRKNKKIAQPGPDDSRKNVTVIKTDEDNVPHEHEPGIKKDNPILIFFESNYFGNTRIYIDSNKLRGLNCMMIKELVFWLVENV